MDKLILYPYQEDGVQWMLDRENCSRRKGGLLLDECGIGKTPQLITTLLRNPKLTTLIVLPVNLIRQWEAQLSSWAPHFSIVVFHGPLKRKNPTQRALDYLYSLTVTEKQETSNGPQKRPLVVLTSYGKLINRNFEKKRRAQAKQGRVNQGRAKQGIAKQENGNKAVGSTVLHQIIWDRIVLDEAHVIRNHLTTRTRYVLALKGEIKWALTATPIHNGIQDYQCLLQFMGLDKLEIAHLFANHPVLQQYLSEKARKVSVGRVLHLGEKEGEEKLMTRGNSFLRHEEISLRRTKRGVFSLPLENDDNGDSNSDGDGNSDDEELLESVLDSNQEECGNGRERKRPRNEEDVRPLYRKKSKTSTDSSKVPTMSPLQVEIALVPFSSVEEMFYANVERVTQLEILEYLDGQVNVQVYEQFMFELILRLRQASVNPHLVLSGYKRKYHGQFPLALLRGIVDLPRLGNGQWQQDQWTKEEVRLAEEMFYSLLETPSKTRYLQRRLLEHKREKAIVFCEFRQEMPFLKECLAQVGITSVLYDGSMSMDERDKVVTALSWTATQLAQVLQEGHFFPGIHHVPLEIVERIASYVSYDVVLVQINSGNAGLNLQMCSRVYFTSPTWNPCTEMQAVARAHRCGQELPVVATKLVMTPPLNFNEDDDGNIDMRILQVQEGKRKIMSDILGDEDLLYNGSLLQQDDMASLLRIKK